MDKPEKTVGTPRKIKLLLFVSLAVNLIIAGLVAGALWMHGPGAREARRPAKDPLLWSFERQDRRALGEALRKAQGGSRQERGRALNEAMDRIKATLAAQPFEEAAFRAAMAEKTALLRRARDVGEAAMIEQILEMSDDERSALAARLAERLSHYRSWREKWRKHD